MVSCGPREETSYPKPSGGLMNVSTEVLGNARIVSWDNQRRKLELVVSLAREVWGDR